MHRHHLMAHCATIAFSALAADAGAAPSPTDEEAAALAAADAADASAAPPPVTKPDRAPRKGRASPLADALAEPLPGEPAAPAVHTDDETDGPRLYVACKLPSGLNLENGIILNGTNHDSADRAGGFGITVVNAALFNSWAKDHQDMVAFKRGLIFSGSDAAKVVAKAREHDALNSGFEQMDPSKMPAGLTEEETSAKARESEKRAKGK